MSDTIPPLKIEISAPQGKAYKSISNLTWQDIPPLAILTGVNGSGKTQLLEFLAYKLTHTAHHQNSDLNEMSVSLEGDTIGPEAIVYLPSHASGFNSGALAIANLQDAKTQLYRDIKQHHKNDIRWNIRKEKLNRIVGANASSLSFEEFSRRLPDNYEFMIESDDALQGLTHTFLTYQVRLAEELMEGNSLSEAQKKLGPAPWDVINHALSAAGFAYRTPKPAKLLERYEIRFESKFTDKILNANDLSSGEKVILRVVLWLYSSQNHKIFPKLYLLDEPDAHLHPSMTQQFMNVIKNVLVDQYNIRVILTTHSPSTVALAPEESIFEMSRTAPRISRSLSKASTIGLLTSGLLIVSPSTKYVLVEDVDDVDFYTTLRDILSDYGPSKDRMALSPAPSIVFLPSSTGSREGRGGGGKHMVVRWVEKFDSSPLKEMFRGIVDLDNGNPSSERIHVISRYSIENYLLDPFVVFCLLLSKGKLPNEASYGIARGDEHLIKDLPEDKLGGIARDITSAVEQHLLGLTPEEKATTSVTFTNGKKVQYPNWILSRRGHDLWLPFRRAFGNEGTISPPELLSSMTRVRLVPIELAALLHEIQK